MTFPFHLPPSSLSNSIKSTRASWVCVDMPRKLINELPSVPTNCTKFSFPFVPFLSLSLAVSKSFHGAVKFSMHTHANGNSGAAERPLVENLFGLSITFSSFLVSPRKNKFASLFSTIKCKKISCSINISLQPPSKEGGSSFALAPQSRWKINERKIYFSLLASFVEMKWCKTRSVASSEINYCEHETLERSIIRLLFVAQYEKLPLAERKWTRREEEIWGFLPFPPNLKHRATCNSGFFFR